MKHFLGVDKRPPALEQSFKLPTKLTRELPIDTEMETVPLIELSSLAEDIYVKTWEVLPNTDLDMQEFLFGRHAHKIIK